MADNVGYTEGSGKIIATDDVAGVQHQRVKITLGGDGVDNGNISASNPLPITTSSAIPVYTEGETIEALEAVRMGIQSLNRSIGQILPDTANRLRVNIEVGNLSTVTTVTTLSNQTQIGGNSAFEQIPALMRLAADALRRNINVT
jgi:hypothetical protein